MRYFLIMNPGSGGGKSRKMFKKILTTLDNIGISFDHKPTNTLEDAYRLSAEANEKDYDVIVAVGGDGTINRVLNGFYNSAGRRISGSKLAVIHTGTSPDFCKNYGIPPDIDRALDTVLGGSSKKILPGKITYTIFHDPGLDGRPLYKNYDKTKTGYFGCCANFGLGASVARIANSGVRKYLGDHAGTFFALLQTLFTYRPGDFTVIVDGQEQLIEKVYNISVGKTSYIASGIKVYNELSPLDPRFYKLVVKKPDWAAWPRVFSRLYGGKRFANDNSMSLHYARSIEIYGSSRNPEVEFDGDPRGFLPCVIETATDPLDLICEVHNG